jgi:hypothetical protein
MITMITELILVPTSISSFDNQVYQAYLISSLLKKLKFQQLFQLSKGSATVIE